MNAQIDIVAKDLPIFKGQQKPNKIRIVFDGAAKTNGVSLGLLLLQGPDRLSSI